MRELFDEVAGHSPLDPQESQKLSARKPARSRFYTTADVVETGDGFVIALDGKPVRTPGKRPLAVPARHLADAIAAEWTAQSGTIDPTTMPLTRLANSTIDGVAQNVPAVAADIAKYFESDLLFYRAGFPQALVVRQGELWDPVLRWAADDLGARFILTEGVMHVTQPATAVAAATAAMPDDAWRVAAMHLVTTITGSALLALALFRGALSTEQVWTAAHVDDDWNAETWGLDDEVEARKASRLRDFEAAAAVLKMPV